MLSVHLSISLCLTASSVSYYISYFSLSHSRRDEVCPVASGRHFPAGRLLPPRSSLQSRRYLYSTHTLCSTPDSNTVSLPLHCTAAITVLSCVALCALHQTLTQCLSTTALYCNYYCIELCCTLCSTADSNTVSLYHCTVLQLLLY